MFLYKKGSQFVSEGQPLTVLWKRGLLHLIKNLFRDGKQFPWITGHLINEVRVKLTPRLIHNIRRPVP